MPSLKREYLYTFKNIILANHSYLRVGDIVQTDARTEKGIKFPVLDVIESEHDPIVSLMNLNGAPYYGNVLLGDDVEQIQDRIDADIKAQHLDIFEPTPIQQAAKKLSRRLAQNHQQKADKPQNDLQFYNVLSITYKPVRQGILVSVLLLSHASKQTLWAQKIFRRYQARSLESFKTRVYRGLQVYGTVTPQGWFKYLKPCK